VKDRDDSDDDNCCSSSEEDHPPIKNAIKKPAEVVQDAT